ncbi:MAG: FtsX-like permease family protein [Cyclobacteriaceae bacterium]|nr:FtsX-like permease family protein [Cyclobacteriaceae bacterium]
MNFELNQAIKEWRKRLQASGGVEDGEAEELVSHLLGRIDNLVNNGVSEEKAFLIATTEIGRVDELVVEHRIMHERTYLRVSRRILPPLLLNYLKVIFRGFAKNKSYNFINIIGLAVGLTCCLLISYYMLFEFSFDKQFKGYESIYRISNRSVSFDNVEHMDSGAPVPLGPALKEEFPEFKNTVRFWRAYLPTVKWKDNIFQERKFIFADSSAFRVFDFPFVKGNKHKAFASPNSVVISESTSIKYFGEDDPIGKVIEYNGYPSGKLSLTVTGVFKDLPVNTHFTFDFLASFDALVTRELINWGSFKPVWTYVVLNKGAQVSQIKEKFPAFINKHLLDRKEGVKEFEFILEPLTSLHLESAAERPMKPTGSLSLIRILGLTGILILLMSCVNFINHSLARALIRVKEVGIRKTMGAVRGQLVTHFAIEVAVAFACALIMSALLIITVLPSVQEMTGAPLLMEFIFNIHFVFIVIGIFMVFIILAGYLPSRGIAAYSIVNGLKKQISSKPGSLNLRNFLIFFQLLISSTLIISLLIIGDQLRFIRNIDKGVTVDGIVALPYSENLRVLEQRLLTMPEIKSIAYSQRLPVNSLNYDGRRVRIDGHADPFLVQSCFISSSFLEVYDIRLKAGRNIDSESKADSNKFVINETAMRSFGWTIDNTIGKKLTWSGAIEGEVIGVVNDYHLESIHEKIPPMVMLAATDWDLFMRNFISIKLHNANSKTLDMIRQYWVNLNPSEVFYVVSLSESFDKLHENDQKFGRVIFYFAVIAIIIAMMGAYSIAAYSAEAKRKEIGVRKLLGSGMISLMIKLSLPFFIISVLAAVLAAPMVIYFMNQWLSSFAYHTSINVLSFAAGISIVVIITLVAILKVTLGAAFTNPIRYLRDE